VAAVSTMCNIYCIILNVIHLTVFFQVLNFTLTLLILQIIITQQWFLVGRENQSAIVKPDHDSENNYRRQRTIVGVRDYCQ